MKRTCSSLQYNEQVVFKIYSDIYEKKIPMDGSVIAVYPGTKKVCVSYLEGYKDRKEFVEYKDMLGVYNPQGKYMTFGNIKGNSDLLIPE